MNDDTSRPIAGWYPDPEEPATYKRYWDGNAWQLRKPHSPAQLSVSTYDRFSDPRFLSAWRPGPLGPGFRRLGAAARLGLKLSVGMSAAQVALYV